MFISSTVTTSNLEEILWLHKCDTIWLSYDIMCVAVKRINHEQTQKFDKSHYSSVTELRIITHTWNIRYASAAQGRSPLGATWLGTFSSSKFTSLLTESLVLKYSSSATTRSNTNDTNCLTVAPAVFMVVESFVKWSLKQSTKFCNNQPPKTFA
jgi:hypothetical protein